MFNIIYYTKPLKNQSHNIYIGFKPLKFLLYLTHFYDNNSIFLECLFEILINIHFNKNKELFKARIFAIIQTKHIYVLN